MSTRILHIVSGDLWGGAEAQVCLVLSAMRDMRCGEHHPNKFEPTALLFNQGIVEERYKQSGIPCIICPEQAGFASLLSNSLRSAKEISPAIIFTHGYKEAFIGAVISRRLGIPLVMTFHGATENYSGLRQVKSRLWAGVQKAIARFLAERIVTVSHNLARELGFEKSSKLTVIPCAALPPKVSETETHAKPQHGVPTILFVGRLVPVKRLDVLISALSLLIQNGHDIRLIVLGDGPLKSQLELQVRTSNITNHVQFLGFQQNTALYFQNADVLALSSASEGMPTVILEAMMSGLPVVSTDLPGVREILEATPDYPITLVPQADAQAFATALEETLQNPSAKPRATNLSTQITETFSPTAAAVKHGHLIFEILQRTH